MPPFPEIGRHDYFGFQTVRQYRPGLLWGTANVQEGEVIFLSLRTSLFPYGIGVIPRRSPRRRDNGDLCAELLFAVIAVPGRLLTIGGQPVTDDFMTHSPVTDKPDGHNTVFNDGLMASLQNVPDKLLCTVLSDLALGLVTSASSLFNQRERMFG